jgi:hypothetical protein
MLIKEIKGRDLKMPRINELEHIVEPEEHSESNSKREHHSYEGLH